MATLVAILKISVPLVLLASLAEALVLAILRGWRRYDWRAAAVSAADMLVREYPLHWLPTLTIWHWLMQAAWTHRFWTLPMDHWSGWLACLIGQDFCYYWYHRAAHRVRWFWCTHAIHHSPNELTLSAAYRFGWTGQLTGSLLFFAVAPLFGMPPAIVLVLLSINLLYQFWLHATWIPRLGPLEWIFNTPSAHRVHHASNLEYLDANYGGILIVFDRMFGTYIPERRDLQCRYGLVAPVDTYNLLTIEFAQWRALWGDILAARSLPDALGYLLKPPGWRPNGGGETTEDLRQRAAHPVVRKARDSGTG
ncbi:MULTISPECIES: sterol desaturase family protein [unclassified Burkholderia]|uniref:sterol desaturase family protein n=1 Tax=unclassified Burkholderia TaxID=2613784 RepID=UPI000F55CE19|nr:MULTISPECIES: sterol desaturase family protein [unclassified Burkholderia]RQR70581.1 sterol desaturase family protein [Burkholderia sp. Bp9012]RQR77858.1 sterol desaturase family protein [Burkholderia sp. Bp9011]RQR87854.1 sterol desaturase family protein [Burkholderia sp. Bp9010]RQZ43794.1 sterol desaturase family protein [Burkholderia sp. Bp9099]